MFLGKVIGEVWASRKMPDLEGKRLLVIERVDDTDGPAAPKVTPVIAADPLGADYGEFVVVAFGKAARVAFGGDGDFAYEAAIVCIVDQGHVPSHAWFDGYRTAGRQPGPGTATLQRGPGTAGRQPGAEAR